MNRTLQDVGHFAAPAAAVIGGSLLTLALVGVGHDRPPSAAATEPTATTTVIAAPPQPPSTITRTPTPREPITPVQNDGVTVADRSARRATTSTVRPSGIAPSGPSPRPTAADEPSTSSCMGAVSVLLPVGVPNCAVTIGGNR